MLRDRTLDSELSAHRAMAALNVLAGELRGAGGLQPRAERLRVLAEMAREHVATLIEAPQQMPRAQAAHADAKRATEAKATMPGASAVIIPFPLRGR